MHNDNTSLEKWFMGITAATLLAIGGNGISVYNKMSVIENELSHIKKAAGDRYTKTTAEHDKELQRIRDGQQDLRLETLKTRVEILETKKESKK